MFLVVVLGIAVLVLLFRLRRQQRALGVSEARFRGLLETAPDAMVIVDGAGLIQLVNAEAERLFGYRRDELLGIQVGLLVPERFRDRHQQHIRQYAEQPNTRPAGGRVQLWALRKDGSEFPIEISLSPLRAGQGLSISASIRDATERKRTDAAIARLAAIVDGSSDAIISLGLDLKLLSWNAAAEKMFGFTAEEAIGQRIDFMIPDDQRPQAEQMRMLLHAGEATPACDTVRLTKDGRRIDVSAAQSPIKDANGTVVGASLVFHDITEGKHVDQALREKDYLLSESQRIAHIGSWLYYLTGQTSWSEEMYRIFGVSPATFTPNVKSFLNLIDPEDRRAMQVWIEACAAGKKPGELEFRTIRPDGSVRFISGRGEPKYDAENRLTHFAGTVQDITARHQTEEQRRVLEAQLRQAQKMEAIGTLAGGIAHDFNNILGAIIGNVELARQDMDAQHPALQSIEEIRKASARAKVLVNQILAFSRQQQPSRHALALAPVIDEAIKLLRATLPAGIALATNLSEGTPEVLADSTQMHQVIVNLCTNAWQAMDGNPGRIDIGLEGMTWETGTEGPDLQPGRYAHLTVSDNGHGMDAVTQARIFEPFFTTKEVGYGTGLGLSVVHGIVEGQQGTIQVESSPGHGATFHLYFPAIEGSSETVVSKPETTAPLRGRGQHVLYLDDEEALVLMVTRMLERLGYRVSGYISAKQALEAVRADPDQFDLVVTDYNMPGMSGLDVIDELARIRPNLVAAVTSGYISNDLRQKATESGVRHLIYKPNTVEELCEAVHALTHEIPRRDGRIIGV